MSKETKISYCDSTCNPVMGCRGCELHSKAAPAASTCYAAELCGRYAGHSKGYPKSFDEPEHFPRRIEQALRWPDLTGKERPEKPWLNGYPRIIFLNDLSDGFNSIDPEIWLAPHLWDMACGPHIWLLCTKHPDVMCAFFESRKVPENVWLMTTITSQATAWRATWLRRIFSARTRLLSLEPLLGPVDLLPILGYNASGDGEFCPVIHGVFIGGASGPKAQPCDVAWIREALADCKAAGVPAFVKQVGARPIDNTFLTEREVHRWPDSVPRSTFHPHLKDPAGRDPKEWPADLQVFQMPEVKHV